MNVTTMGEKIKRLRGDMTRKELADKLGVSESAVQMWENGERVPRDELKIRIAECFNTTVEFLFFEN